MPYRVEYAGTGQAKCKGAKPCQGTKIDKGDLRFGTVVTIQEKTSFAWRHWGCVTPAIITNIKKELSGGEEDAEVDGADLDGWEDLREEDQTRISTALSEGHIDDADKSTNVLGPKDPLSDKSVADLKEQLADAGLVKTGKKDDLVARLREHLGPMTEEEEAAANPPPKKGGRKKKASSDAENDDEEEKPAKKKAKKATEPKPKKKPASKRKKEESEEEEAQDGEDSE